MSDVETPADDLEKRLEAGLRRALDPIVADVWLAPVARYALLDAPGTTRTASIFRRILTAGGAALALTAGTAIAAAAATTGSLDTAVWGRHVSEAVETCRSALPAGEHGIGPCVSAIASSKHQDGHAGASQTHGGNAAKHDETGEGSSAGSADKHGNSAATPEGNAVGHGGTPPGQDNSAPASDSSKPGNSVTNPGHGGAPHGGGATPDPSR